MTISVVIPTYNTSRFIRETANSVFAQSRLPDEIIIVDDASRDGTPAIVQEIAAKAPLPLRLIELPRNTGGPATAMNVGIEAARGDYIALLDHDDLMLPEKLALQAAVLDEDSEIDMVMGDYASFSDQGIVAGRDARGLGKQWHALLTPGPGPIHRVSTRDSLSAFVAVPGLQRGCSNMFFRRSFWTGARGFDPRAGAIADYDFILRAVQRPIAWIDQRLYCRREHDSNLWRPTVRNQLQAIRSGSECLIRNELPAHVRAEFISWAANVSVGLRVSGHYLGAVRVAAELALLSEWRLAARQCVLTCTYPFRAAVRKAKGWIGKRSEARARLPLESGETET